MQDTELRFSRITLYDFESGDTIWTRDIHDHFYKPVVFIPRDKFLIFGNATDPVRDDAPSWEQDDIVTRYNLDDGTEHTFPLAMWVSEKDEDVWRDCAGT